MTTKEVADYLRLKERKVYDLVGAGEIPCTRVTGKWLFPKHLIDIWLARSSTFPKIAASHATPPPPVIVGSHDPLLEWAVRTSGCELALMAGGSLDGVQRFSRGEAVACGMHVLDLSDGGYNVGPASEATVGLDCVLVEWAWREQGLIVAAGNPMRVRGLAEAAAANARFVIREIGAGSRVLFQYLVSEAGLDFDVLDIADVEAHSETDVGLAIVEGRADAGLGIRAAAHQYGLDFIPLHRERYDLMIRRRDYFQAPLQRLRAFCETAEFKARAEEMAGYDISGMGTVHYNAP
ncbi:helix-turn-helix transcriptional regulator [Thalassospiraceae bacterium LMO-JJ14]|nr:helix-turn-helix transcriptional regulator [Thalassospiraceae bacterium LMO-JJ14]